MLADGTRSRLDKVFYGWWIVASTGVVNAAGGGVYFYGFSIFFLPIKEALNISSAAASLVFSLSRAQGAFEGPLAGYLYNRVGPRAMLTVGMIIVGIGYVLLSQVHSYIWFLLVYLGIISLAFNGSFSSTTAVVNTWFVRRKSLAMAISMAAWGFGGFIIAPVLSVGILHLGWRLTAALSGIFLVAVTLPFIQLLRRSPESMGLQPDGDIARPASADGQPVGAATTASADFTVGEALRTRTFWILSLGTMLRTGTYGTLIVHFVPIMVWKNITEQAAAVMLGATALIMIPIMIGLGWLGDRWDRSKMLVFGMAVGALFMLILQYATSEWHLWVFVCAISMIDGLAVLNWSLLGELFGRSNFAMLRGIQGLVHSWGIIIMPVVAGAIFDRTDSYSAVIWVFVVMYVLASVIFGFVRQPQVPTRPGRSRQEVSTIG